MSHEAASAGGQAPHPPLRRILLADCDTFFVQVARLEDPEGAGAAPLLMVGGSAKGRGVVTSADYAVRRFGVHSGMPMSQALRLCPDAMVVPVPRKACTRRSRQVLEVLNELSPVVQAASIDEFYLDLTGTERLLEHQTLEATGRAIQEEVRRRTGITVSMGGGTVRLVAKLAVERAKPGGVYIVPPGEEGDFLKEHSLSHIPGVGPALVAGLEERGLRTVKDLLPVQEHWLRRWFGPSRGRWLWERARGIDPTPVDPDPGRKSISSERTFPHDILPGPEGEGVLARQLQELSMEVGRTLRQKGLAARTITVKLRDADFTTRQGSRTLSRAVESDRAIHRTARDLLGALRDRRPGAVRLLGVGVSSLTEDEDPEQLDLLGSGTPEETDLDRTLSRTTDQLRERFGEDAVLPARRLEEDHDP